MRRTVAVLPFILLVAACAEPRRSAGEADTASVVTAFDVGAVTPSPSAETTMTRRTTTTTAGAIVLPAGSPSTAPELPRAVYDPTDAEMPVTRMVKVKTAAQLQAALDAAKGGDAIVLPARTTFTGTFTVYGARDGSNGWVTVMTDPTQATVPALGYRVGSGDLGFATLTGTTSAPVLTCAPGTRRVHVVGVRIVGGAPFTYALAHCGSHEWTKASDYPDRIVFDRVQITASDAVDLARCLAVNGTRMVVRDSDLRNCHGKGRDAQAVWSAGGAGPYLIANDYLEGSGENVMFGGADSKAAALIPQDITIVGNRVRKPPAWKGGPWSIKNLLELKSARRVLIEGNHFSGNWGDAQDGTAILFKSTNQDGTAPWSETSDVTFRGNVVDSTDFGLGLAEHPESAPVVPMSRVLVQDNVVTAGGRWLMIQGVADLTVDHNTGRCRDGTMTCGLGLQFNQDVSRRLTFTANDVPRDQYGRAVASMDGHGEGDAALHFHAPGALFRGNRFPAGSGAVPSTNGTPAGDAGARATSAASSAAPKASARRR